MTVGRTLFVPVENRRVLVPRDLRRISVSGVASGILDPYASYPISNPDGDRGDVTVSGGGVLWRINDNAVGLAKLSSAALKTIGALTPAADRGIHFNAEGAAALHVLTEFARTLLAAVDGGAMKTLLAYAASDVANTPAGTIAATTVQAAINALDVGKVGKTGPQTLEGSLTVGTGAHQVVSVGASDSTHRWHVSGGATGWALGLNRPGDVAGTTLTFSSYASSAWATRATMATGAFKFGDGSGTRWVRADGGTGTAGGGAFLADAGGVLQAGFGIKSAILGGTYDNTVLLYGSGSAPIEFRNGAQTQQFMQNGHIGWGTSAPNKTSLTRATTLNTSTAMDFVGHELATAESWRAIWFASSGLMGFRSNGIAQQFDFGTSDNFSFSASGLISTLPFKAPAVSLPQGSLALVTGANQNAARPNFSSIRITGPSGAFNIGGLTGGVDGVLAELINTTGQTMTLNNEDASSTAGNRILTPAGSNLNCKNATLRYDATTARWRVISSSI